ncbi:50S ribosomal protein L3 [Patescibacteria group bacterium]|nr:50S ribosomal protein L3 [Patescibacteria group bacterium]
MIRDFFVTKRDMCQAWTKQGQRLAVTRVFAPNLMVINQKTISPDQTMLEVGFGKKKLKNMTKPLQTQIKGSGFLVGARKIKGIMIEAQADDAVTQVGKSILVTDVLTVGDVVDVQGTSKGRGFAGAVKRYGFHGGPKTHGQSDRGRAVGSIGAGTSPGHVWKGKKMPGHYGVETKTILGLVVLYIDPETHQVWLNGPIPGSFNSLVRIRTTGQTRKVELDPVASGLPVVKEEELKSEENTEDTQSEKGEVVADQNILEEKKIAESDEKLADQENDEVQAVVQNKDQKSNDKQETSKEKNEDLKQISEEKPEKSEINSKKENPENVSEEKSEDSDQSLEEKSETKSGNSDQSLKEKSTDQEVIKEAVQDNTLNSNQSASEKSEEKLSEDTQNVKKSDNKEESKDNSEEEKKTK